MDNLETSVSKKLTPGEVVLEFGSTQYKLLRTSKSKVSKILFWLIFLFALTLVVFLSDGADQPWVVGALGKFFGFVVLLFAALWWFNLSSFFQPAEPSRDAIKYHHYALTSKRLMFFSKKWKWKRDLFLNNIEKIDVSASRNKMTMYLDDPFEPTITLNGMKNPLKFAKRIDDMLHGEFGL